MDLIITSKHVDFEFPKNFKINRVPTYCNNLVLIFNDESEIKKPDIKYNKLFVINNIPNISNKEQELMEYKVKEIIDNYQFNNLNLFIKNKCHTWECIFNVINRELNKKNYFEYIKNSIQPKSISIIYYTIIIILLSTMILEWYYYKNELIKKELTIISLENKIFNNNKTYETEKTNIINKYRYEITQLKSENYDIINRYNNSIIKLEYDKDDLVIKNKKLEQDNIDLLRNNTFISEQFNNNHERLIKIFDYTKVKLENIENICSDINENIYKIFENIKDRFMEINRILEYISQIINKFYIIKNRYYY